VSARTGTAPPRSRQAPEYRLLPWHVASAVTSSATSPKPPSLGRRWPARVRFPASAGPTQPPASATREAQQTEAGIAAGNQAATIAATDPANGNPAPILRKSAGSGSQAESPGAHGSDGKTALERPDLPLVARVIVPMLGRARALRSGLGHSPRAD
jgi:hypothetical protein